MPVRPVSDRRLEARHTTEPPTPRPWPRSTCRTRLSHAVPPPPAILLEAASRRLKPARYEGGRARLYVARTLQRARPVSVRDLSPAVQKERRDTAGAS